MKNIPDDVFNDVERVYLEHIEFPLHKPAKVFLLCPIGLVGAGKTTVMKPLCRDLGLVRISGDEIRKLFHDRGCGYERVKELSLGLIRHFLGKGFSVGIDSDCIGKETQEAIREIEDKGIRVVWIHINPPEEFILTKLKSLTPNWLGTGEEMVKNYLARKPLHEHLDFSFAYVFDTSQKNLSDQVRDAALCIQEVLGGVE